MHDRTHAMQFHLPVVSASQATLPASLPTREIVALLFDPDGMASGLDFGRWNARATETTFVEPRLSDDDGHHRTFQALYSFIDVFVKARARHRSSR